MECDANCEESVVRCAETLVALCISFSSWTWSLRRTTVRGISDAFICFITHNTTEWRAGKIECEVMWSYLFGLTIFGTTLIALCIYFCLKLCAAGHSGNRQLRQRAAESGILTINPPMTEKVDRRDMSPPKKQGGPASTSTKTTIEQHGDEEYLVLGSKPPRSKSRGVMRFRSDQTHDHSRFLLISSWSWTNRRHGLGENQSVVICGPCSDHMFCDVSLPDGQYYDDVPGQVSHRGSIVSFSCLSNISRLGGG